MRAAVLDEIPPWRPTPPLNSDLMRPALLQTVIGTSSKPGGAFWKDAALVPLPAGALRYWLPIEIAPID